MNEQNRVESDSVWLLNLGYISDNTEQDLIFFAYMSTPGVVTAELVIDVALKSIKYAIILNKRSYFRFSVEKWLEKRSGLWAKLALLCFLRVFGTYDPTNQVDRSVKEYAGKDWKTSVEVVDVSKYQKLNENRTENWFFKE